MACLSPTGAMLFTVPIRENAATEEDFSPTLSDDDRLKRLGQTDVRMFGAHDILQIFAGAVGDRIRPIAPDDHIPEMDYAFYRLPRLAGLDGATVFMATASG